MAGKDRVAVATLLPRRPRVQEPDDGRHNAGPQHARRRRLTAV